MRPGPRRPWHDQSLRVPPGASAPPRPAPGRGSGRPRVPSGTCRLGCLPKKKAGHDNAATSRLGFSLLVCRPSSNLQGPDALSGEVQASDEATPLPASPRAVANRSKGCVCITAAALAALARIEKRCGSEPAKFRLKEKALKKTIRLGGNVRRQTKMTHQSWNEKKTQRKVRSIQS